MITVESALLKIQEFLPQKWRSEATTAEALIADRPYPPFNRVMMDGIAVSFEAFKQGKRQFPVEGICAAGDPQKTLDNLTSCLEVMTGTPMPVNADLVIQYEHLKIENGIAHIVQEQERIPYENVHMKGSDCPQGAVLLSEGHLLNGPHRGIAASLGFVSPKMNQAPRINIISTGDELVAINEIPLDHQIRRSNAHALEASLRLHGFQDVVLSHLSDKEDAIESHYKENSSNFDVLIYSGGVSKGKFDYLPSMWNKMGVTEHFHGISQRPGKPLWFGMDEKNKTAVFGLPGNPVSSLVCLHRYFLKSRERFVILDEEIIFKKDLTYFVPVKIHYHKDGLTSATPLKIQNSGEFSALAGSDGFIELPKNQSVFKKGEAFAYFSWGPN